MIWFEKELQCKKQPNRSIITLVGIYNSPNETPILPTIVIRLTVEEATNATIDKILFEKSPTVLQHEEPMGDDILAKYHPKILKLKDKIQDTTYEDILQW